jgi:hypothetical protein
MHAEDEEQLTCWRNVNGGSGRCGCSVLHVAVIVFGKVPHKTVVPFKEAVLG